MRSYRHGHPCRICQTRVECGGELERNPDGWPEVICRVFHLEPGPDFLCESCQETAQQQEEHELRAQEAEELL